MSGNIIDRFRARSSKFYSIRERVGYLQKVYILTRTWANAIGSGNYTDSVVRVVPTPGISNLEHRRMVTSHGETSGGDIHLTGIAYDLYDEQKLGNVPTSKKQEKFFLINGKTYVTVSIDQRASSWSVVLKKATKNLWRDTIIPAA